MESSRKRLLYIKLNHIIFAHFCKKQHASKKLGMLLLPIHPATRMSGVNGVPTPKHRTRRMCARRKRTKHIFGFLFVFPRVSS